MRGWGAEDGKVNGNDADEYSELLEEAPRPPPPAPTPMATAAESARPRRLRQTWGGDTSLRGASSSSSSSSSSSTDRHRRDANGAIGMEDSGRSGTFIPPSKLQEASMWSTAVEQAALERRMREVSVFDGVYSCHTYADRLAE